MPEKRLSQAHGRCFLSRSRCTVASSVCCLLALALLLVAALVTAIGKLGMGNFLPLNVVLLVGGLGSLLALCVGAACRRRKTSMTRGEGDENGPRGPQLHVVTLMQRTRLDEQELARREWRMREEDRRQEKEQMEREQREKEVETTEGEQISFAGIRWRQDDTTVGEGTDGWQQQLLVVKNIGGEEDAGSSIEPAPVSKQVKVHVHQPG